VSGYHARKEGGEKLYIGSQPAWVFPDPNAKAAFLEFTGQGLARSRRRSTGEKKQEMAMPARG
jgi:hypothetical protein